MSMDGARREIKKLRDALRAEDREFKALAPPVDAAGLPDWTGDGPLSVDGYAHALGDTPDADLTDAEADARHRLAPYAAVFARLDEKAGGGEDVTT